MKRKSVMKHYNQSTCFAYIRLTIKNQIRKLSRQLRETITKEVAIFNKMSVILSQVEDKYWASISELPKTFFHVGGGGVHIIE